MIGRYQGNVAAATRSWATAHDKEVVGFIRAYVAAIDWLYDAANRDEAVHVLTKHLRKCRTRWRDRATICCSMRRRIFPPGKDRSGRPETVLQLRSRHGEPKTALTDAAKYCDPAYYDIAMRG